MVALRFACVVLLILIIAGVIPPITLATAADFALSLTLTLRVTPSRSGVAQIAPTPTLVTSAGADPAIANVVNPELALPDETIVFTITVSNSGSEPASGVEVTDLVPDILSVLQVTTTGGDFSIAGQTVTVAIGTVNPSEVITMTITTRVLADATPREEINTAYLYWNEGPPRTSNAPYGARLSTATIRLISQLPATGIRDERRSIDGQWLEMAVLTGGLFVAIYLVRKRRRAA